ncbi:class III extradiol ring-cleavage dioxygenase [Aquidulcibacter sp.]|uniref:DODA-type extradiol aromatic ring-opening family dioxygenase n=1 Tax=Aquidulcibacter sp. TaxID=2052990 RepID=UPI0025C552B3|nr:class III extradiol ring-cleavage dioxygenase [Aquidulcibacter sp.]MCA3693021.1 dioxygenase [Aquidulcibacter sp.]
MSKQPAFFIPHGGGPCFFMEDSAGMWTGMARFLESLPALLPEAPKAILVVSAHWETKGFAFTGAAKPGLLYDYYGFPPHTYALTYPAPGAPSLAAHAASLLRAQGIDAFVDPDRELDHGVFIPLKVAFPDAHIPVVEMSVEQSFDPALHLAAGQALIELRDEGVMILGSGMSFHNMRAYGDPRASPGARAFDDWLTETVQSDAAERTERLSRWSEAPSARFAHPLRQEEHLLPLLVAAGSGAGKGERIYNEEVLSTALSGYRF